MDDYAREIFKSLLRMAHSDGEVAPGEQQLINRLAQLTGCSPADMETMRNEESRLDQVLEDHQDRREAMCSLMVMAFADDFISPEEYDYLQAAAGELGISAEEMEELRQQALQMVQEQGTAGRIHLPE